MRIFVTLIKNSLTKFQNASIHQRMVFHRRITTEKPTIDKTETPKDSWVSWKLSLSVMAASLLLGGSLFVYLNGAPDLDKDGNEIVDEYSQKNSILAYTLRSFKAAMLIKKSIEDPTSTKLLPDPLKAPYYQPPYTLVIELTGVLLNPDWTLSTGWRFKKRPGLDYFFQQLAPPLYEIVIFTQESGMNAYSLIDGIDTQNCVMYRLYKDSTRYIRGKHVKDLDCLNRDLSRVIYVDWNEDAINGQNRNSLKLQKWNGEDSDKTLFDLTDFLKMIAVSNVEDVREVIDYYRQYDDPIATFRDNQRRLKEETELADFEKNKTKASRSLLARWNKR